MQMQRTVPDPEPWPLQVPSRVRLASGGATRAVRGEVFMGGVHGELGTNQNQTQRLGGAASKGTWRERFDHFRIPGFWGGR